MVMKVVWVVVVVVVVVEVVFKRVVLSVVEGEVLLVVDLEGGEGVGVGGQSKMHVDQSHTL